MTRTSTRTGCVSPTDAPRPDSRKRSSFGCRVERHVADLVEQQRAARGGADDAGEVLDGAGEGAAPMAEELRVEHVLRGGGAVEGDEGALAREE